VSIREGVQNRVLLALHMFEWYKGELILRVEMILLEVRTCSFWLLQLIVILNLLLNLLLLKLIQTLYTQLISI